MAPSQELDLSRWVIGAAALVFFLATSFFARSQDQLYDQIVVKELELFKIIPTNPVLRDSLQSSQFATHGVDTSPLVVNEEAKELMEALTDETTAEHFQLGFDTLTLVAKPPASEQQTGDSPPNLPNPVPGVPVVLPINPELQ
jgi:hypothetical protein